jgi:hypothetical protein
MTCVATSDEIDLENAPHLWWIAREKRQIRILCFSGFIYCKISYRTAITVERSMLYVDVYVIFMALHAYDFEFGVPFIAIHLEWTISKIWNSEQRTRATKCQNRPELGLFQSYYYFSFLCTILLCKHYILRAHHDSVWKEGFSLPLAHGTNRQNFVIYFCSVRNTRQCLFTFFYEKAIFWSHILNEPNDGIASACLSMVPFDRRVPF